MYFVVLLDKPPHPLLFSPVPVASCGIYAAAQLFGGMISTCFEEISWGEQITTRSNTFRRCLARFAHPPCYIVASVNQSLSFEKKKKNPESGTLTRERLAFMFPVSGLLAACLLHVLFSFCPVYAVALPL